MAKPYRTQFDIDLTDLELIENALRYQASDLGNEILRRRLSDDAPEDSGKDKLTTSIRAIQSVLGKLHNQKIWYTPKDFSPLG